MILYYLETTGENNGGCVPSLWFSSSGGGIGSYIWNVELNCSVSNSLSLQLSFDEKFYKLGSESSTIELSPEGISRSNVEEIPSVQEKVIYRDKIFKYTGKSKNISETKTDTKNIK